jgi:hypothetical protein
VTRRLWILLVLALLAACDRGPGKPPGLGDAGPLVAEFARAAKGLDDIAPAMAAWNGEGELPGALAADMTEVGEAGQAVVHAAEPDGDAGAAALSDAVADAANEVVRHLVTAAGGHEAKPGRMALNPPGPVDFDTGAKESPQKPSSEDSPGRSRTELGKIEAQERLEGDLYREIERFVYVALLADPATRAALALRLSPDDLPAEVPEDLNLSVANRQEWREDLFDDQNRLVVPTPVDHGRWRSFIGWTKVVNSKLRLAAENLIDQASRSLSG